MDFLAGSAFGASLALVDRVFSVLVKRQMGDYWSLGIVNDLSSAFQISASIVEQSEKGELHDGLLRKGERVPVDFRKPKYM